jgi:hypothetical protein
VSADVVHTQTRRDIFVPVVKYHASGEKPADHRSNVLCIEWPTSERVRHVPSRAELHFAILNVVTRNWKQFMVAAMVVMHMRDDDVFHSLRLYTNGPQTITRTLQKSPATAVCYFLIKSSINDERAPSRSQYPDVVIQRHR